MAHCMTSRRIGNLIRAVKFPFSVECKTLDTRNWLYRQVLYTVVFEPKNVRDTITRPPGATKLPPQALLAGRSAGIEDGATWQGLG